MSTPRRRSLATRTALRRGTRWLRDTTRRRSVVRQVRCSCGDSYPAGQAARHFATHRTEHRKQAARVPIRRTRTARPIRREPTAGNRPARPGTGVGHIDAWVSATEALIGLEPSNVAEFERILTAFQRAVVLAGNHLADLGERWTADHQIDQRITAQFAEAGDRFAESSECFRDAQQQLKVVYRAYLELIESGTAVPRPEFFTEN
ncbi:hypothetical protein FHR81_004944 [Actinoalloteichus hoggarensis]|uniref:Uncharacterized protein n=1 Tax=Actinoalloteichus hoggarensis TaxID=1470176 RepID=A0A221W803_9PSEU|nr:hypothetical protein [Actinoalloteichus hoggarensis]ASO22048.1 hypothetical protein AHOG_22165 [Actinoalloteichus hoggarensis]MBB5923871.1 hypothetical protein [Actinoalloteichus hoggarensis]